MQLFHIVALCIFVFLVLLSFLIVKVLCSMKLIPSVNSVVGIKPKQQTTITTKAVYSKSSKSSSSYAADSIELVTGLARQPSVRRAICCMPDTASTGYGARRYTRKPCPGCYGRGSARCGHAAQIMSPPMSPVPYMRQLNSSQMVPLITPQMTPNMTPTLQRPGKTGAPPPYSPRISRSLSMETFSREAMQRSRRYPSMDGILEASEGRYDPNQNQRNPTRMQNGPAPSADNNAVTVHVHVHNNELERNNPRPSSPPLPPPPPPLPPQRQSSLATRAGYMPSATERQSSLPNDPPLPAYPTMLESIQRQRPRSLTREPVVVPEGKLVRISPEQQQEIYQNLPTQPETRRDQGTGKPRAASPVDEKDLEELDNLDLLLCLRGTRFHIHNGDPTNITTQSPTPITNLSQPPSYTQSQLQATAAARATTIDMQNGNVPFPLNIG